MRSLVGASRDDMDEDDDAPPPRKRARARSRPKGGRSAPGRVRRGEGLFTRWAEAMRSTAARMLLWAGLLAAFFASVVVAGLFSGGHVSAALASAKAQADGLMASAGLSVQRIAVDGGDRMTSADVNRITGIRAGDLMLYVDIDEARARLEAQPWVRSALVRRTWPNKIHISVVERRPVALWQIEGSRFVIDGEGRAIAGANPGQLAKLPLVVGKGANTAANGLLALLAMHPDLKSRVKVAVRVGERRWNLRLANGVEIRIPEEGAEAALAELVRLERAQNILARDIKSIDLRLPDRFIVKPSAGTPLTKPTTRARGRET